MPAEQSITNKEMTDALTHENPQINEAAKHALKNIENGTIKNNFSKIQIIKMKLLGLL